MTQEMQDDFVKVAKEYLEIEDNDELGYLDYNDMQPQLDHHDSNSISEMCEFFYKKGREHGKES